MTLITPAKFIAVDMNSSGFSREREATGCVCRQTDRQTGIQIHRDFKRLAHVIAEAWEIWAAG